MHTAFYERYIRSDTWQRVKELRLEIDGGKCVMCGRPEAKTRNGLQCHHITYARLGREVPYTDVVTLCGSCHRKLHNYLARKTDPGEELPFGG